MEFDTVMSINPVTRNDPMRQQRLANVTCYMCSQKGHYRKDSPNSPGTSPVPDHTSSVLIAVHLLQ